MRLDRYIDGEEPRFRVLRKQPDGTYKEVPALDYFVLALKDWHALAALKAYSNSAMAYGDYDLRDDVRRLMDEASVRPDRKMPD